MYYIQQNYECILKFSTSLVSSYSHKEGIVAHNLPLLLCFYRI